jgi:hypothetical protein
MWSASSLHAPQMCQVTIICDTNNGFDTWDHLREWNARKDHLWKFLSKGPCRRCRRRHVGLRSTPCGYVTMPPLALAAAIGIGGKCFKFFYFIHLLCYLLCHPTCATSPCRQRGWRQGPPAERSHVPATATAAGACTCHVSAATHRGFFLQKISQV